jgi:hypothetical protein
MQVTIALNQLKKLFHDRGVALDKYSNNPLIRLNKKLYNLNLNSFLFNICVYSMISLGFVVFLAGVMETKAPSYIVIMLCSPIYFFVVVLGLRIIVYRFYSSSSQNYIKWYTQNICLYDYAISMILSNFCERDYIIFEVEQMRSIMIEEYRSYINIINVNKHRDHKFYDKEYILYLENLIKVWKIGQPEAIEHFNRCFNL